MSRIWRVALVTFVATAGLIVSALCYASVVIVLILFFADSNSASSYRLALMVYSIPAVIVLTVYGIVLYLVIKATGKKVNQPLNSDNKANLNDNTVNLENKETNE